MKLTADKALELLKLDVVGEDDNIMDAKYNWVRHSICVGNAARVIARELNLDEDYACALGYIHDIGRKIDHPNHAIEGYYYMIDHGYSEEANICLTHSFIDNKIQLIAGEYLTEGDRFEFFNNYLSNREVSIYDNIIQLCDLLCLPNGVTTIEKRLLDIYSRKGIFPNTLEHFCQAIMLKMRIEKVMGHSIYSLFDNFNIKEIDDVNKDCAKIKKLLNISE